MIRRFAFKYSENSYLHWLPLIFADRVNVVEGVLDDLVHGHIPNIFVEKGYKVQWKYDRTSLILKLATVALVAGGAVALITHKSDKSRKS
jgi:hypothetical protein